MDFKKRKGNYERHDAYYHAAKKQGFVARSIFKLGELDQNFSLIKPNDVVLDLGCAPGSWLQYIIKCVTPGRGFVVGIDLLPVKIATTPQVKILTGDIFDADMSHLIPDNLVRDDGSLQVFNLVLSDMAPSTTGIRSVDQDRSMGLCERALEIANVMLKPGGKFCVKVLEGRGMQDFIKSCRAVFSDVKIRRPKGTRSASMETYVIGLGKK